MEVSSQSIDSYKSYFLYFKMDCYNFYAFGKSEYVSMWRKNAVHAKMIQIKAEIKVYISTYKQRFFDKKTYHKV